MTQSVILDIQEEAMNESLTLSSLLLKAYTVATKLELRDFADWAKSEMNGYNCFGKELPDYRSPKGRLRAFNGQGWTPVQISDRNFEKLLSTAYCFESMAEIEDILCKMKEEVYYPLNGKQSHMVGELVNFRTEYAVFVSRSALKRISTKVRTSILDWALELEKNGVKGEGVSFTRHEKEIARVTTNNITISGPFQGILGDVQDSQITQNLSMTNQKGDTEALIRLLKEKDVSDPDIEELMSAIELDGEVLPEKGFGVRVSSWIGNMITKAATGAWSIGVGAAGSFLGNVIGHYYGLS
ncbi:hypothetical protein [Photobacterium marinum]|nr:hypothetical protein [Photobacterium marinum]